MDGSITCLETACSRLTQVSAFLPCHAHNPHAIRQAGRRASRLSCKPLAFSDSQLHEAKSLVLLRPCTERGFGKGSRDGQTNGRRRILSLKILVMLEGLGVQCTITQPEGQSSHARYMKRATVCIPTCVCALQMLCPANVSAQSCGDARGLHAAYVPRPAK